MQSSFQPRGSPKSIQSNFFVFLASGGVISGGIIFFIAYFWFFGPGEQLKDSPKGQNGHFDAIFVLAQAVPKVNSI